MLGSGFFCHSQYGIDGDLFASWFPRGVGRVAKPAAEVASGGSDEKARGPGEDAFPLSACKGFRDAQATPIRLGRAMRNLSFCRWS